MNNSTYLKNIKKYAILSAIIPFIAINVCIFLTNYISAFNDHVKVLSINGEILDHSKKYYEIVCNENNNFCNDYKIVKEKSANCNLITFDYIFSSDGKRIPSKLKNNNFKLVFSKNIDETSALLNENELKNALKKNKYKFDDDCVNKFEALNLLYNYFPIIDKIHVKRRNLKYPNLLQTLSVPYIDGKISISRAARYYPTNIIFKLLMIPAAFFMFFFWLNNNKNFNVIGNKKINRSFLIFGTISAACLLLHSIFLGIKINLFFYEPLRKLNLIMFIFCEVVAQFLYLKTIYKMKKDVIDIIHPKALLLKLIYIILIVSLTLILMLIFIFVDTTGTFNNVVEWNYFSIALVFYLLCFFLWKENPDHTPRGV